MLNHVARKFPWSMTVKVDNKISFCKDSLTQRLTILLTVVRRSCGSDHNGSNDREENNELKCSHAFAVWWFSKDTNAMGRRDQRLTEAP